jgi:hypothetical protein
MLTIVNKKTWQTCDFPVWERVKHIVLYIYLKQYVRIILNIFYWWLLALFSAMKSQTQTEFFQVYQIELSFFVQQILFYILHSIRISILLYLGLYNVQDFAQILYFVGGVHIITFKNHLSLFIFNKVFIWWNI